MKEENLNEITLQLEAEVDEFGNDYICSKRPLPSKYAVRGKIYNSPKELLKEIISDQYETQNERWHPRGLCRFVFGEGVKLGDTISIAVSAKLYKKK